ncbi:pyruvate kinase [Microscilla marina]|uniref:Pyruvate kinase n=1 Tax=Microscilla marina ATCC 23134 TaxID=313606 RepID=A1ZI48_MICM2|nr:pyruvate kinase [Microscilla marina]EAY29716.1 pyruvate kinase [Microscilla marina ATCC 23134]
MKPFFNKTKVIATVGPAINTKEKLLEMVLAGTDVFRLNFSHGSHDEHKKVIQYIRELNKEHNLNICILQDLQGPKIRLGEVASDQEILKPGKKVVITNEPVKSTAKRIYTTYKGLIKDVKPDDQILIDDGKIELKVIEIKDKEVVAEVIYGGQLKSKKGINLPSTAISSPSLTEKDTKDLMFGLAQGVDWIALSFVRSPIDVLLLKHIIKQQGKETKVIAKIEKPEAISQIDEIIEATDAIMIARGDLGVEVKIEEVPIIQKMVAYKCRQAGKPVIIATQMLESMIDNPRPTRAETNDIANAVMDGADTLMLSGETAVGKYPIETVTTMNETIRIMEQKTESIYHKKEVLHRKSPTFYNDSIIAAACVLAQDTHAKGILGMTQSGYTAFQVARFRPKAHIFIFTANRKLLNRLSLVWGVRAFYYDKFTSTDDTFDEVLEFLQTEEHIQRGDICINLASMPIAKRQRTNTIKLSQI